MFLRIFTALVALLALGCAADAAPLEAYGKLPNIERAEISPSGELIAYIATDGDTRKVAIQTTKDHAFIYYGDVGTARLRDLTWAGEDHLILTTSTAKQPAYVTGPRVEYHMAHDLDLKTKRIRLLMRNIHGVEDALDTIEGVPDVRILNGRPTVFVRGEHFVSNEGHMGLFKVDLESGAANLIANGANGAYDWVLDANGEVVAEAAYKDRPGVWKLSVRTPAGAWRAADRTDAPITTPSLIGLSADGGSLVVDYGDDKTGSSWSELALDSGKWGATTVNASDESAVMDPQTGRIIGKHALVGDDLVYTFFDAHDAAVWRAILKAYPGASVSLSSWSADRKKIVVHVDTPDLGAAFAIVDLGTGQADWLGSEYPGLKAEDISPQKPVRYKAADGLEITGYLTLPRGRAAQGLPLIVLAHGGPHSRDEPGFDWWSQALASRGYAVLQANFRGSDGFGWPFLSAGFGEWGRKMQTDLSDGVRHLAKEGVIDPKRVCIVGASYGGYAALAGATIDHGVYRCAISVAGISNLKDMLTTDREVEGRSGERFWLRYAGASATNDPVLAQYSPALRAAEADIPVLLIHGRDDTRVPIAQSRQMADALRRAGKPVELIELAGEDHFLTGGATRLQMLTATVAFLEKNNPPN
jgi:dipeptidyl aminopeptidase/acylaminoacyl peptidase